jgi:hypothetical protein
MGAQFQFTAKNAKTGNFVQAEIYVGGVSKGHTKENGTPLPVKMNSTGSFDWYAKKFGENIDQGRSSGGRIEALYEPR